MSVTYIAALDRLIELEKMVGASPPGPLSRGERGESSGATLRDCATREPPAPLALRERGRG